MTMTKVQGKKAHYKMHFSQFRVLIIKKNYPKEKMAQNFHTFFLKFCKADRMKDVCSDACFDFYGYDISF